MTAPAKPLTMKDLFDLYKPGQIGDLASMLNRAFTQLTSATFSRVPQGQVQSLGRDITTIRANALVGGLIDPKGPNAASINSALATYAQIPATISGYTQPPVITDTTELANDNKLFRPVILYLSTALTDLCNTVIYNIIEDKITIKIIFKSNTL
jgi:hypothetical protein